MCTQGGGQYTWEEELDKSSTEMKPSVWLGLQVLAMAGPHLFKPYIQKLVVSLPVT